MFQPWSSRHAPAWVFHVIANGENEYGFNGLRNNPPSSFVYISIFTKTTWSTVCRHFTSVFQAMVTIRIRISYLMDCTLNILCRLRFCTGVRFGSADIRAVGLIAYLRVCALASVRLVWMTNLRMWPFAKLLGFAGGRDCHSFQQERKACAYARHPLG